MSKEILLVAESVSNEKGVSKEVIFEAIEAALASATQKKYGGEIKVRVRINRTTGNYSSFRVWDIVEDTDGEEGLEAPEHQIGLSAAQVARADAQVGEVIEEPIEPASFGRIAAQTAKQVIVQKVRDAERAKVVDAYRDRVGELVTGLVKRLERGDVILDLGSNAEAMVLKEQMIPRESVRSGDRMRGYLYKIDEGAKGPQLFVSRTAPELLSLLFKLEVPEVGEGLIELLAAARDPGSRAKIAVRSRDSRIDPVGACVGMRGSRVQAVSNELSGERVDIIVWDPNPAQFVINAMSPADVVSIVVDEEAGAMDVAVKEENLPQAIGRAGQNVRLASQLTGWELNVMNEEQAARKSESEVTTLVNLFRDQLGVDEDVASILVQEGFTTIDEVAFVPMSELLAIEEFDERLVMMLRERAKDVLLTKAIASEESTLGVQEPLSLGDLKGMDAQLLEGLAGLGVKSLEDLAEQSVDELLDIPGMDQERAADLILQARQPWFSKGGSASGKIPAKLADMDGMSADLLARLADLGVATLDDLAERSVDELLEIDGMDERRAAALIMKAREPWFAGKGQ